MITQQNLSPLISYYGGKQRIAHQIVPCLPPHSVYVEPFSGGLAVLFKKGFPDVSNNHHYREVINDTDQRIINFYRVARNKHTREELINLINSTLYSREEHKKAVEKTKSGIGTDIELAHAYYINIMQGFSRQLNSGFSTGIEGRNNPLVYLEKRKQLDKLCERIEKATIENLDAIDLIKKYDSPHTCFYCDPPYVSANQGHYSGYTQEQFNDLIYTLDNCKGSFVLSHYANAELPNDWNKIEIKASMSAANGKLNTDRKRIELLYYKDRSHNCKPSIKKILTHFGQCSVQSDLF